MSNLEKRPAETWVECDAEVFGTPGAPEIIGAREVPLGGPRAMTVHRTLPSKQRTMIGAWCFVDHYGPSDVAQTGGMVVPPHPHTGLQTVSWLFEGEIEHRDSVGSHAFVRPGVLNLMTAGHGISHSEMSTPATTVLHGAQLWVALPEASRQVDPFFESHTAVSTRIDDAEISVFVGDFAGASVGATTFTALSAAEIRLPAGGSAVLPVRSDHEYGVLVDTGRVTVDGVTGERTDLVYTGVGRDTLTIATAADAPDASARLLIIGGEPLDEQILMWWNFVGRSHEEIVEYRTEWQQESGAGAAVGETDATPPGTDPAARRFGDTDHHFEGPPLPAPVLPNVRLQPRRR
ncbi:pirin family protein [Herbiconiux sp. P16]|uniref:pirin family protein n=1 Tax=Herbiconiux wuyangfengii TaxID=3342794 RepID=UPI0035B6B1A9